MISIVTAYYNRKKLLIRTLESLKCNFGKIDFEMIVVDDGSIKEERLEDLLEEYPFLRIHRIEPAEKWYKNPCIPFNIGLSMVKGEKVILQNPECYHFDSVLEYVDNNLKANSYFSFGCFSLDKINTDDDKLFFDRSYIDNLMKTTKHVVKVDGGLGWYNHSKYRASALHFCTAIFTEDIVDLGGFDSRYAMGHGFDDDELVFRIRNKGMKIKFIDDVRVLHQNHYIETVSQKVKYSNPLAERNKTIYETITKNNIYHRADYLTTENFKPIKRLTLVSMINQIKLKIRNTIGF